MTADDPSILQFFRDLEPLDLQILASRGIQSIKDIHLVNNLEDFEIRSEGISLSGLARIRRIRKLLQAPPPPQSSSVPKEDTPLWIPQPTTPNNDQPPWIYPGVVVQYPSSTSTKKLGVILTTEGSHIIIQPISGGGKLYGSPADLSLPPLRLHDTAIIISGPFRYRTGSLIALSAHQATVFADEETVIVPPHRVVRFQRMSTFQPLSSDSSTPPPLASVSPPIIYYPTSLEQQQSWLSSADQILFHKLHLVCFQCKSVEELQETLKSAAHLVNTQNIDALFPLHYPLAPSLQTSAQTKHQFVKLLLDHGARIDVPNRLGHTPMDYASNDADVLKLFSVKYPSLVEHHATKRGIGHSSSSQEQKSKSTKKRRKH